MDANTGISRVAIVGSGLVGSSWAACFLARGLDVVATDPAPGTEDKVRQYVEVAWTALTKIGLAQGASTSRLRFESNLKEALAGVDMVQENAPEREPLKIKLFAEIDSILPPPAILVSSTSGIPMSRIQSECRHPERCVTGHPFNPPHLIPLVEVVGGAKTSAETIERAMRFYTAMGKRALHIRKEVVGHVANRLSAALYRELAYLIDQDVVSVADADAAVCMGPGLRWALMGPNLIYHLGGGPGGIHHFLEHFTGSMRLESTTSLGVNRPPKRYPNRSRPDRRTPRPKHRSVFYHLRRFSYLGDVPDGDRPAVSATWAGQSIRAT
jgi:3-hydroxyacyl-CoA dehydrogenase